MRGEAGEREGKGWGKKKKKKRMENVCFLEESLFLFYFLP